MISTGLPIHRGQLEMELPREASINQEGLVTFPQTEGEVLERELRHIARNEKAAQLLGHRPSEQEGGGIGPRVGKLHG